MRIVCFLFIFAILIMSKSISAQQLPVKKVTIFKNGTAMIIREGKVNLKNGSATLPIPSTALYGTYFLGSAKENAIKQLQFKNDTIRKKEKVTTLWQQLASNTGKNVTLFISPMQKTDKTVQGKIIDFNQATGFINLKTDKGYAQLHADGVYMIESNEENSGFFMQDSISRMITLSMEKNEAQTSLQEIYLQNQINWMPSYFLKLKDGANGRLEMKATLENFADDLTNAPCELVVGAPQMLYSNKPDPMTYDYYTGNEVHYGGNNGYMLSNAMQAKAMTMASAEMDGAFTSEFATSGEKLDDQYIYKLGTINLAKQAKGSFPIFAANVEYSDRYEGNVPDKTNYFATRYCDPSEGNYDIYHSLEIKNTTSVPLTTAPITVVNENEQFLAQDELKYTPVGAKGSIKLSKAIDIILKNTEEESDRNDAAKKVGKVVYAKVTLKGQITIENFQDKDVKVNINKDLTGTVNVTSDNGKITKNRSYSALNPYSNIKWEVSLKKGEKKTLTYEYEVFYNL